MIVYYYTFRSMTAAMTAAGKLKKSGYTAMPVRTPEGLRKKGCGYCIAIPENGFAKIRDVLSHRDYEKLYAHASGEWKEVIR